MTSRERVRAVLNHQLPDRVPNGLGGCETEGLHIVAYDNLQKILGVERKPPRLDTFMTNAVFEEPVIRAMDGDIILLASPNMCKSELRGANIADQWKEQELWGWGSSPQRQVCGPRHGIWNFFLMVKLCFPFLTACHLFRLERMITVLRILQLKKPSFRAEMTQ